MLPLHKEAKEAQKSQDSHAGLWYDRFFDRYDKDWSVPNDEKGKLSWIQEVTGETGGTEMLEQYAKQQQSLCSSLGGQSLVMCSDWHFVTGLGNNHPVENGFAWHHTLGVPYLTGAAVKGMVRAWCEVWEGFDEDKIRQWFGDTNQSGELIFFDAVPTAPVKLKTDIMTPHYGDWYSKGDQDPAGDGSNIPADWHDPVPIPFLVVDKGASFQFCIANRADSDIEIEKVITALIEALQWLGAGAKTAAGYGRFSEDENAKQKREKDMREQIKREQKVQEQQKLELEASAKGLTGLAAELSIEIKQKGLDCDKSAWGRKADALVARVREHDNEQEKDACKDLLLKICEKHDKGIISNPDKTKGKKNKPVYGSKSIKVVKELLKL